MIRPFQFGFAETVSCFLWEGEMTIKKIYNPDNKHNIL